MLPRYGRKVHSYTIRACYGSDKLLVEFGSTADNRVLRDDIIAALESSGAKVRKSGDQIFSRLIDFDSPAGGFTLDEDEWGLFWIIADDNQFAIEFAGEAFNASRRFERQDVDFEQFRHVPIDP